MGGRKGEGGIVREGGRKREGEVAREGGRKRKDEVVREGGRKGEGEVAREGGRKEEGEVVRERGWGWKGGLYQLYTNHSSQSEHALCDLGRVGAGLVGVPHDNTHKVVEQEVGSTWGEQREHL